MPASEIKGKQSLSATNLAVHHHFNCDLYLHNVYHQPPIFGPSSDTSEISKAHRKRGVDWEKSLFSWLERENLLLTVPSRPLDPNILIENILADGRDHFFISGLTFVPPQKILDERFYQTGRKPIAFGLAKPDLLEIVRTTVHRPGQDHEEVIFKWKVIDAKSSSSIKAILLRAKKSLDRGELGAMPNISIDEARMLKALLRDSRSAIDSQPTKPITDIEDLLGVFSDSKKLLSLSPDTVKKGRRILGLSKRSIQQTSPIIDAARHRIPQLKHKRSINCPKSEDVAVLMSLVSDPSLPGTGVDYYAITIVSANPLLFSQEELCGPGCDLVSTLSSLIQTIVMSHSTLTIQFYVWSPSEHSTLQTHFINAALMSIVGAEDIRICIGALSQGASLLLTTYQPTLLSGTLLNFLTNSKRTKADHIAFLERLGLSTEGSTAELRERVDHVIQRLKPDGGLTKAEDRTKVGQLPRVVLLKTEVDRLIALPVPGYWDLVECANSLLSPTDSQCPSEEEVLGLYQVRNFELLEEALFRRNKSMYNVLQDVRRRIENSGEELLVNDAEVLSSMFMDLCRQEHIRKLFFVQQFEVLTRLNELWRSRIDGCPDTPVLKYVNSENHGEKKGYVHNFHLLTGALDTPANDKGICMYDKIITLDDSEEPSNDVPVEALFDDLAVSGLVFPLGQSTRKKWEAQDPRVKRELRVADLVDVVVDGNKTRVVLKAWGDMDVKFIEDRNYRLSPRLVDFNTSKTLAALLEADLRCFSSLDEESENTIVSLVKNKKPHIDQGPLVPHNGVPLLQMIVDPGSFGRHAVADEYLKTENIIQKLFRELKDLGDEDAALLILKSSQHRAAQRILSNRLSVIWGPPGNTPIVHFRPKKSPDIPCYCLQVQHRHGDATRKIIFITAMTHAAIDACRKKVFNLMNCYRRLGQTIESFPTGWLDQVNVEQVLSGTTHRAPSSQFLVNIFAGTTYQRHSFSVDCVVIDEAGQLSLSSVALVVRALSPSSRIIIAGDSEQLAPIMSAQYPRLKSRPLFGSVLDCLMGTPQAAADSLTSKEPDFFSDVVQLTENFRLNPDLGDFVSTIYSRAFKPQKVQARQLARHLKLIEKESSAIRGIQTTVLKDVQEFLVSFSKVMLREPQDVLTPPGLPFSEITSGILAPGSAPPPQAISLALIKLKTRSMNSRPKDTSYEAHVRAEAAVAAALVTLIQRCSPHDDVFVATPHRVQREAVKAALRCVKTEDPNDLDFRSTGISGRDEDTSNLTGKVTVDTIERLQGSEAAFVICLFSLPSSSTSTELGFLLERRRLNVAISRAKTLCIVVSSEEVLRPNVSILADEDTAKGYVFLRAFEERAWAGEISVNLNSLN
ncbi:hypothetical protein H0H81_003435 [Sphagnurus paluster]|uniref:DNA2/NAM7 helicase-like C-terminal domain-containing protein n=1 Tax=Sphagnurus paluster TaxID=117069 RepID=A0A9P7K6B3_9AGAR|nr:hypothetical protein H0H81_003435 [Sphagnurus paluster]